ncbi:MAG: preprotein translocase subunit SecA, partial [Leptospiraceae bacterium]|nr:preprotein translocase subunit SecA [Leptospiraceae bacterium]
KAQTFISLVSSQNKQKKMKEIYDEAVNWNKAHEEVLENGGLYIIGTERHESRRIDNQLRGRSGRQGDPGTSRFYLSLEDDLLRIFGADRISGVMQRLGMEEGQEIEHKMVTNAIARSQKRVEGRNFDIRKHLLEYDDVMNKQRMFIYKLRDDVLDEEFNLKELILQWMEEVIENQILVFCETNNPSNWEIESLNEWLHSFNKNFTITIDKYKKENNVRTVLLDDILKDFSSYYDRKMSAVGKEVWTHLERNILLEILDHRWKDHLYTMDHLRDGIWTEGYSEKNPLVEYKLQGFKMFQQMVDNLKNEIINFLLKVEVTESDKAPEEREYQKVGDENTNVDIFTGGNEISQNNKRKVASAVSSSSGGASSRKSGRRRKR